jgi:pimeloyl-ACP methyl ester carboxylesterase
MTCPESFRFTTPNGFALHASIWPNAGMPSCVLLHGFGHHSRIWDPLARRLHADYEVVALDFRGHGDSAWDRQSDYSHETLQQDLQALISALKLTNFHLLGHSLGARIAMLYAAEQPQQVSSLTIMDTGPEASRKGIQRIRSEAANQPAFFADMAEFQRWLRTRHPLARASGLQSLYEHGLQASGEQWRAKTDPAFVRELWRQDFAGAANDPDNLPLTQKLWQCLSKASCPTLVLKGQISSILSRDVAKTMVEHYLVRGQLDVVPMAGHAVLLDNPDYCIAAISGFLGQQPHPGQTASLSTRNG